MKKILLCVVAMLIAISVLLCFSGCNEKTDAKTGTVSESSTDKYLSFDESINEVEQFICLAKGPEIDSEYIENPLLPDAQSALEYACKLDKNPDMLVVFNGGEQEYRIFYDTGNDVWKVYFYNPDACGGDRQYSFRKSDGYLLETEFGE